MGTPVCVMVLLDSELREEVFLLMELARLKNYTHFVGLRGSSDHGKKENTAAWPGSNEILLLILSPDQVGEFTEQVKKFKAERKPAPGLLMFTWPLKELL